MKTLPEYNLFNAADNTLLGYLCQDDFEKSLLLNILFQDKMLMHGGYFFDSTFLARHIKKPKGEISLFEAAARVGLIVPVFWDKNVNTIRENQDLMIKIYGQDYKLLSDEHDPASFARMCYNVDAGREFQNAFIVPENINMAEDYYEILKRHLQRDELPAYIQETPFRHAAISKYWKRTKKWRTELVKLVTRDMGLDDAIALDAKNNLSEFLDDPEDVRLLNIFLKWIAQCRHLNQATVFDSSLNFPVYNINEDFMCESIARIPADGAISKYEGFECTVNLPLLKNLLRENHSNLISIRQDLGISYLFALREWQKSPTEKNQETVMLLLQDYCKNICHRYKDTRLTKVKVTYSSGKDLAGKAVDVLGAAASINYPLIGIFLSLGKFGYAVYEYISDIPKSKTREISLEINLKETSKQYEKIL